MQIREGGSYIRDPETGELRPNIPAEPSTPITAPEGQSTPAGDTAGGDEAAGADTSTADAPPGPRRRAKKGD